MICKYTDTSTFYLPYLAPLMVGSAVE